MTRFFNFASGSSMLTERLKAGCAGAVPDGIAVAPDYSISYCRRSGGGSTKVSLVPNASAAATEVLFSGNEWESDTFEGKKSGAFRRAGAKAIRRGDDHIPRVSLNLSQVVAHPRNSLLIHDERGLLP